MHKKSSKKIRLWYLKWLKRAGLMLAIVASFVLLVEYTPIAQLLGDLTANLTGGGSGLRLERAVGEAQISADIVQTRTFGELVTDIVNYFLGFLGFLGVIVFIYAGVLWVLSFGNEEAITKSKKIMTYAALGLLVVMLSYSAVNFITASARIGCTTAQDCPDANTYACEDSICRKKAECSADQPCTDPDEMCLNGRCVLAEAAVSTCTDRAGANPCPRGYDCIATTSGKQCRPTPTLSLLMGRTCQTDVDCLGGLVCLTDAQSARICMQGCILVTDCATGFKCLNADTNDTSATAPRACKQGCLDNTDCLPGFECLDTNRDGLKECQYKSSLALSISKLCADTANSSDCAGGLSCLEEDVDDPGSANFCMQTCVDADDCAYGFNCIPFDPEVLDPNKTTSNVCMRGCEDRGDCLPGYECTAAGQCRYMSAQIVSECSTEKDATTGLALTCTDDTGCTTTPGFDKCLNGVCTQGCTTGNYCKAFNISGREVSQCKPLEEALAAGECRSHTDCSRPTPVCDFAPGATTGICKAPGAAQPCDDTTNPCPSGYDCDDYDNDGDNECRYIPTTLEGDQCTDTTSHTDCPLGFQCRDDDQDNINTCYYTPCTTDANCPTGYKCKGDNICHYPGTSFEGSLCASQQNCPMGYECTDDDGDGTLDTCHYKPCVDDSACPIGYKCDDFNDDDIKECRYKGSILEGDKCDATHLCSLGYECEDRDLDGVNTCYYTSCTTDANCPAGYKCEDFDDDLEDECHYKGMPLSGSACTDNSGCPFGYECADDNDDGIPDTCQYRPCDDITNPCPLGYDCKDYDEDGDTECKYIATGLEIVGQACEDDADCPINFICKEGACQYFDTVVPPQCTANENCPSNYICRLFPTMGDVVLGQCKYSPEGQECLSSFECTEGQDCKINPETDRYQCVNRQTYQKSCSANNLCPGGYECRIGTCVYMETEVPSECGEDQPCLPDYLCQIFKVGGREIGQCKFNPEGQLCTSYLDCAAGQDCIAVQCVNKATLYTPCSGDNLCPTGYNCDTDGECRYITTAQTSECRTTANCQAGYICAVFDVKGQAIGQCKLSVPEGQLCTDDTACPEGQECILNAITVQQECKNKAVHRIVACVSGTDCPSGDYCSIGGICKPGRDTACRVDTDCAALKTCDASGFCRNPQAGFNAPCADNSDCSAENVCNLDRERCEYQGSALTGVSYSMLGLTVPADTGEATLSTPAQAAAEQSFQAITAASDAAKKEIANINSALMVLPEETKNSLIDTLTRGTLADKIAEVQQLLEETDDPATAQVLEKILNVLNRFHTLREELDKMREVMPESAETIATWDETSGALNAVIDDPTSIVKVQRFDRLNLQLNELIRKFPVVQAKIRAVPAEGNAPVIVTLDGMDSMDPTGGTVSQYKWSYLDNQGNTVSLGGAPVFVHEFKEANTYVVRLQTATSQRDAAGYKTAMDGIATVRIKVRPPASQVRFRIDGAEAGDVHHVTLKEAMAGLTFDPSSTVPALGRIIEEYEWMYGDTIMEKRTVPSTVVHSYDKPGEYFVTLKVKDNHGVTDKQIVKLLVKSLAADIRISPPEGNVNTNFNFQGQHSRSDDGSIQDYEWQFEDSDGKTVFESVEESFYYKFNRPGNYKVILLVTDTTGAQDKQLEVLKIKSRPPSANFTYTIPRRNHPNQAEFNAVNSYDPDEGDKITYSWDFDGDGDFELVNTGDIKVVHEYEKTGEYRAVLQVEDAFGQRSQVQKSVSITSVLSGDIILKKQATQTGEEVTFEVESPNAVSYLWEFGDGESSSTDETTTKYTYSKKGKYKVILNFFDDQDHENLDTGYLLIGNKDEPVSVINLLINGAQRSLTEDLCGPGKDGITLTRADRIAFNARGSINVDGTTRMLSYDWQFSDGTRNSNREFNHIFDEINRPGACSSMSLGVRDRVSGKVSDKDEIYFKVVNQLPTIVDFVIADDTEQELVTPTKVKLKAVNPKDADGQIKKYRWWYFRAGKEDQKSGIHSTASSETEIVITAEGQPDAVNRYYFVLEITDNDGGVYNSFERFGELSFFDIKNGPNMSPVTEFTVDKTTIATGDSITFISQAYDPQGSTLPNDAFRWDFDGDGAFDDVSSGPQINRQYNTPGEYNVRLKVVHRGLSSSVTKTVFVEATNAMPQAAFTYKIDNQTVTFDAGHSRFDPDLEDKTLRYEWDFDVQEDADGNGIKDDDVQSQEMTPFHIYPEISKYNVRLKVKDMLGMEGIVVRDINLTIDQAEREKNTYRSLSISSPDQALTALDLTILPYQLPKGGTADINVSVLNADNSPYFGEVFFEIVEGSGEFSPNPVEAKDSKAAAMFMSVDSGTVRIRVRATGTYYGEIIEEATIFVK